MGEEPGGTVSARQDGAANGGRQELNQSPLNNVDVVPCVHVRGQYRHLPDQNNSHVTSSVGPSCMIYLRRTTLATKVLQNPVSCGHGPVVRWLTEIRC